MKRFIVLLKIFTSNVFILFGIMNFSVFIMCSGCYVTDHKKFFDLSSEISSLNVQYKELQQDYADLYTKVNTDNALFNSSIQDLQNKMFSLDKSVLSLYEKNANEFMSPSSIYGRAYCDYLAEKYDLAYSGFELFISKYPNDTQVQEAKFYMNECSKILNRNKTTNDDINS